MPEGRERDVPPEARWRTLSRRTFIGTGAVVATGATAAACAQHGDHRFHDDHDTSAPQHTPLPPTTAPTHGVYAFFDSGEANTVESLTSRIIPGDDDDPGAAQAGVTNYIDGKLAQFDAYAEPTYRSAPFADGYEGEAPPGPDTDEVIYVHEDELYRYGHQIEETPQQIYRDGIAGLDLYAEQRFGSRFRELDDDQQDAVLAVLDEVRQRSEDPARADQDDPPDVFADDEDVDADLADEIEAAEEAFGDIDPGGFFDMIWVDTIEGMFSDPMYGGNRNLAGWSLIGFPGAQRSYSPREMKVGTTKQPQSADGLHAMNPDHPDQHAPPALERYRDGVVDG